MTDTAKLMIEAGADAMMQDMFAEHELPLSADLQARYYHTAKDAALAMLRALHAAGPSEGMLQLACDAHKPGQILYNDRECFHIHNARVRWQAMLSQLIAEIEQGGE